MVETYAHTQAPQQIRRSRPGQVSEELGALRGGVAAVEHRGSLADREQAGLAHLCDFGRCVLHIRPGATKNENRLVLLHTRN